VFLFRGVEANHSGLVFQSRVVEMRKWSHDWGPWTSRQVVNAFLHASGWSRAETLEFRIGGHVAEIGAISVAVYTLVHDRLLVHGPYRPAEVGSKSFDLVAWSEKGREDGGVRSSEFVTLFSVVDWKLFLPFVFYNLPHLLNVFNPTFHPESSSSAVVFRSEEWKAEDIFT